VARCPHLWLVEYGESPFPFPSVSHHCYVSLPGVTVGQREQRRYCLTKRYTTCPLFPSPPEEEMLAAAAEPVLEGTEPVAAMEPLAQEPAEKREPERPPARPPEKIIAPELGPEPVVGLASREPVRPPVAEEILVEPGPVAMATTPESSAIVEPARDVPSEPTPRITLVRFRALPWAVAGVAALALLCIGAVVVAGLAGLASGIDISTLQLPSLGSSLLLVVSGVSFVGAILLLALLLWARRRGPA